MDSGAVIMNDETRKVVLVAYQERKREEIIHPFIDEKVSIGLLFHVQALLLARYLRGDIDSYPPFMEIKDREYTVGVGTICPP